MFTVGLFIIGGCLLIECLLSEFRILKESDGPTGYNRRVGHTHINAKEAGIDERCRVPHTPQTGGGGDERTREKRTG